jgi:hypothetical protein
MNVNDEHDEGICENGEMLKLVGKSATAPGVVKIRHWRFVELGGY